MLPLINGKSFLSCAESDLLVLLDNEDYRENEYIDYKLIATTKQYYYYSNKSRKNKLKQISQAINY